MAKYSQAEPPMSISVIVCVIQVIPLILDLDVIFKKPMERLHLFVTHLRPWTCMHVAALYCLNTFALASAIPGNKQEK